MNTHDNHKELEFLNVFQEVTRLISMAHDPQEVMELVVERLPALMEVDAATIRLLDEGTNTFVLGAAYGVSNEYLSRPTIDSEEVLAELRLGKPTAHTNLDVVCSHESSEQMQREGVKGTMSLPILYQGKVIGILRLLTRHCRYFSRAEIDFAMSLAKQVGITITKTRMYHELKTHVLFLEEIRRISKLVNSTLDLDTILSTMVEKLPTIMGVKGCTIRLLHPATNRLELVAASGLSSEYLQRGSISRENAIFNALQGKPVAIYDAPVDARLTFHEAISREGIKSILAVPIRNHTEVIGVLRLLTAQHHVFTPGEINFAETVAEEGGNAIEKARVYRKITLLFNQIEEHERFLSTIMDSLWLQLLVVSPDRRVVMANRVFLETQGFTESEVLGRSHEAVSPWAPAHKNDEPLDQIFSGAAALAIIDEITTPNGTCWIERHLTPILDADGNVEFVIEAVRDITDQKMLEREKMERVKLEGVVEMAGTAAHELNTPLFAALGTAQLLADDLESPVAVADMELIIRHLQNIAELTGKMTKVTGFTHRSYVGQTSIVEIHGGGK